MSVSWKYRRFTRLGPWHVAPLVFQTHNAKIEFFFFKARDYVEGMWLMLQQPTPSDFVLATGEMHSVREFTEKSFKEVGMKLE